LTAIVKLLFSLSLPPLLPDGLTPPLFGGRSSDVFAHSGLLVGRREAHSNYDTNTCLIKVFQEFSPLILHIPPVIFKRLPSSQRFSSLWPRTLVRTSFGVRDDITSPRLLFLLSLSFLPDQDKIFHGGSYVQNRFIQRLLFSSFLSLDQGVLYSPVVQDSLCPSFLLSTPHQVKTECQP